MGRLPGIFSAILGSPEGRKQKKPNFLKKILDNFEEIVIIRRV
jgi:hypothetical protein